jgi:hypothetical protein
MTSMWLDSDVKSDRPDRPRWDAEMRQLLAAGKVVKQYRQPAKAQECILAAFEELGWPARIDDPLPSNGQTSPKRRLHDTIKQLNRNQENALIRFSGDGTGTGVKWEWVQKRR